MMNHSATARTAPLSDHPGSLLRRISAAVEFGWLLLLGCVVLWLAEDECEEGNEP